MPSRHEDFIKSIKQLALTHEAEVIDIYHYLHQHPELSFKEYNTARYIENKLAEYGINSKRIIETGVIAEIQGDQPGKTIALRADMDALPIQEDENHSPRSKTNGVMHACGHDMHTASLLGTAKILQELKDKIKGKVILIFQPGEEYMPSGAKMIMESGILENYNIDWIVGQHTDPEVTTGKIGFRAGPYMASADEIYLTIKGKGGHAGFPHQLNDTVLAASQIIVSLQHIVSRRKNPVLPPSVISFGKFIADGATNVIPNEVKLAGTLRCMNEEWRNEAKNLIRNTAELTAKVYGASCEVNISHGYPAVTNREDFTLLAQSEAKAYLGNENVVELPMRMAGEDFGFYTLKYPATFYRFGIKPAHQNESSSLHTPKFLGDANALKTSMGTMAWIAFSYLAKIK
ncbi:amidohydrolase [Balneicella halophila]|uniref:Amidohydrolase n=1 Tax=Balneicella halophila TaxID=1537566 RepID=A0A7L4UMR7_BALHA|nr:M20 family metallopeptidase [Balneicella halophila]PVX49832.1 amidohydrolase [Balneicella halophila]